MKRQHLKIDFIDESVNVDNYKSHDLPDYIGSVRISLHKMLSMDEYADTLEIINMDKKVMGKVRIVLKFKDADSPEALALLNSDRENAYKN